MVAIGDGRRAPLAGTPVQGPAQGDPTLIACEASSIGLASSGRSRSDAGRPDHRAASLDRAACRLDQTQAEPAFGRSAGVLT